MDFSAVQGRRDAIGRYSSGFKRESNTGKHFQVKFYNSHLDSISAESNQSPMPKSTETCISHDMDLIVPTPSDELGPVLKELKIRYDELNRLRKTFYSQSSLSSILNESEELEPCELGNFKECMYEIW
jgi:hypothetical protein